MGSRIYQYLIDSYSAGPSESKVTEVATLQNAIRSVLGEDAYDTFLQGSYRNGTTLSEVNDVDIVARRKATISPLSASLWASLFTTIAQTLASSYRISGRVSLRDKCVKLRGTSLNADIVPAVAVGDYTSDPVAIWSRSQGSERPNYPRTHYANGVKKQRRTSASYKGTVRLLKRWSRQYVDGADFAPSFYIECAVHEAADSLFNSYLPLSFVQVGREICRWSRHNVIHSVAGDKDILVSTEWHPDRFELFQAKLQLDVNLVISALSAPTNDEANRLWKRAFGA
jgi:hypothetical protein